MLVLSFLRPSWWSCLAGHWKWLKATRDLQDLRFYRRPCQPLRRVLPTSCGTVDHGLRTDSALAHRVKMAFSVARGKGSCRPIPFLPRKTVTRAGNVKRDSVCREGENANPASMRDSLTPSERGQQGPSCGSAPHRGLHTASCRAFLLVKRGGRLLLFPLTSP